jgi:hypothetical protein
MTPERLIQLLDRRKPDGTRFYPREDVLHFMPLLLLIGAPDSIGKLPPNLHNLMLEFSGKLNVPPGASGEVFRKAIDAHYAKNPINPQLIADFREVVNLEAKQGNDSLDTAPAADALRGFTEARHVPVPQRGGLWGDEGGEKKK